MEHSSQDFTGELPCLSTAERAGKGAACLQGAITMTDHAVSSESGSWIRAH